MSEQQTTLFGGVAGHGRRLERHGGHVVAETLKAHGTTTLFTLCGGHVLPILDACPDHGIRVIDTRHEQGAVMMAEGYAYATRTTGVCAITAGPGFTNAVTGIADANHSGVPLVVLGGRTPLRSWKRDAIQDVDQLALARPITKRANTCFATERLAEYVAEAFWHAWAGRPGPVYVELPTDVLLSEPSVELTWRPGFPSRVPRPQADPADVAELADALARAERPVVICGSGPFWGFADEALARFAETTAIPVTTTGPSRGLLPDTHPGCLGGLAHGGVAVLQADLVVICGSRFDGNLLFGGPPLLGPWQRVAQIDVRAEAFGGNRAPDLAVQGDAGRVLSQIADAWDAPPKKEWLEQAREAADGSRAAWSAESGKPADGIHPGWLAQDVNALAHQISGGDCTLVVDGGEILTWGIAHFEARHPGRILTTGTSLGTLGLGVPFAVAAKAARPDEPVFLLVGDGSFGLSAMELDTAARHGLPVVCVVSCNGAWADVCHEQDAWFGEGRYVGSELGIVHYERLAATWDGYGAFVERPEDLRPALKAAVDSGGVAIVNVRTDPKVVSEILRGVAQLGVM